MPLLRIDHAVSRLIVHQREAEPARRIARSLLDHVIIVCWWCFTHAVLRACLLASHLANLSQSIIRFGAVRRRGIRRPGAAVWSLPSSRLSAAFNAPAIGDIAVPDASTDEAVWCSDARAWRVALLREPLISRPTAAGSRLPLRRCATKAKRKRATVRRMQQPASVAEVS